MSERRPLYHTTSAPACQNESRGKKLSAFWNAWFFHLSLPYQINVIRKVSIPCKIASDPNLGLEETAGRPLGIGRGSLYRYQAASHSVWNKHRRQKAKRSESPTYLPHITHGSQIIPGPFTNNALWLIWWEWISRPKADRGTLMLLIFEKLSTLTENLVRHNDQSHKVQRLRLAKGNEECSSNA